LKLDKILIENKLQEIISNTEIFLVDVKVVNNAQKIQIKLDKLSNLTLNECASIHRELYTKLEEVYEDFDLEISSPGLDSPFKVIQQYIKNIERELEITTNDNKIFKAILKEVDQLNDEITLEKTTKKEVELIKLKIKEINKSKIVISFK